MSGSKRRRTTSLAKARDKRKEARAKETQAAQRQAARRQVSLRAYRLRRTVGWSLVALGVIVGVSHWLEHLQVFQIASPGVEDVVAGYPMAGLLGIVGSIILSR